MFKISTILFPVDFSARCRGAAAYVEAMAGRFDAELILLHVTPPPTYNALLDAPAADPAEFDRFFGEDLKHLRVQRVISHGEAGGRIVECAAARGASLIMLPTQGKGVYRRLLLGSTAAKVLHDADCPVWTGVHLENAPPLEAVACRRILCAVDLPPAHPQVMQWACGLAAEYQAELTLLHVAAGEPAQARRTLESMLPHNFTNAVIRAVIRVEEGDPARTIARVAGEIAADLLVIGRKKQSGILGRLDENGYAIIRRSPCPVLSV